MELKATKISYELNNEEGLSSVFIEYDNGYFTVARMEDEENIYIEKDDQANGEYWECDCFEISLRNGMFVVSMSLNNKKLLKYIEDNGLRVDLYCNTSITFEPIPTEDFMKLSSVVKRIFSNL